MPTKPNPEAKTMIAKVVAMAGGQYQLAERLGVTQQNISKWFLAGHTPFKRALQISEMFNVPARSLVDPKIRDVFAPKKRA